MVNKRKSYELRCRLGHQGLRQPVSYQAGLREKLATGKTTFRNSPRKRNKRKKTTRDTKYLNILQLNIDGMSYKSGKKEQLAKILSDENIHIALIQESQHKALNPHITGYTTYACECQNCQGVIIYVRNDTTADVENLTKPDDPTHVQKATIWKQNKKFTIYNVYSPPGTTCKIDDLQESIYKNTIVAGDFNGHSPLWGYQDTNNTGKFVEELHETTNLILQQNSNTAPTLLHKASSTLSTPDLTMVSSDLDPLYTLLPGMGSDHRPILINIQGTQEQNHPQHQRLRWNFQKARWNDYSCTTEEDFKSICLENETNPDILESKIETIISQASKKHIPRGVQRKYKPFWNSEVEIAVAKRQEAREALENSPNITNKIAYNKASAKVQHTILNAKRNKWQTDVSNIDLRKNGREAWTLLNNLSGNKRRENPRPMPEGETAKKKAELLNKHFYSTNRSRNDKQADEELLRELKQLEKETPKETPPFEDVFTLQELSFALKKLKKGKSPGPDNIHNEMIIHLGPQGKKVLLHLINMTWNNGKIPKPWRNAHIIPIHKKGKDPKIPKSYRPISLSSCIGKVAERMVNRRLYWWLESNGLISEIQAGYRAANRTEDQLLRLIQSVQDGFQKGVSTTAVFVDFQQAYDRVWRKGLLLKMQRMGITGKMYSWVKDFLSERTIQTKVENEISEKRVQEEGLPQGSALSCTLFLIFLNDLPQELRCEKAMYADDLVLWKTHKYVLQGSRHLNRDLDALGEYCRKWKITVNPTKTVYSIFSLSHKQSKLKLDIRIDGTQALKDQQPTYLGVQLDSRLTLKEHTDNLKRKANKRLSLIKCLSSCDWGSDMTTLRGLYIGYVRSILDCNMSIQMTCSKIRQEGLDKIQNNALRMICGGMKTTPTAATEVMTNVEPLSMRREKSTIEAYERCKRMPDNHPARQMVDKWKPQNRIKAQSILHHSERLGKKVNLSDNRKPLTKTSPFPPNKQPAPPHIETKLKGNTKITKKSDPLILKNAAQETVLSYPETWTHVYTDGSAEEATKNAGWGVWILKPDGNTVEMFDACGADSSNYEAEVSALSNALDHLQKEFDENPIKATSVVVFTDSLSALEAMEGGDQDESLIQVSQKAERLRTTHSMDLKLQWIPGHIGIHGNEKADKLAKQGSQLPQPSTPITLKTAKQNIKKTYRTEWMNNWSSGSTARTVYTHMKTVKTNDNMKKLSRKDQTAIFRLRTQHVPLNNHLNRFNPEIPPLCPLCDHPYETVEHVLMQCRKLEDLRAQYLPVNPNIENMLYGSLKQLKNTATFYNMACARRANAHTALD